MRPRGAAAPPADRPSRPSPRWSGSNCARAGCARRPRCGGRSPRSTASPGGTTSGRIRTCCPPPRISTTRSVSPTPSARADQLTAGDFEIAPTTTDDRRPERARTTEYDYGRRGCRAGIDGRRFVDVAGEVVLEAELGGGADAVEVAAGPLGARIALHQRPEVRPVPGHQQVREFVHEHVVAHPVRHVAQPLGDPDRAVGRGARRPPGAHAARPSARWPAGPGRPGRWWTARRRAGPARRRPSRGAGAHRRRGARPSRRPSGPLRPWRSGTGSSRRSGRRRGRPRRCAGAAGCGAPRRRGRAPACGRNGRSNWSRAQTLAAGADSFGPSAGALGAPSTAWRRLCRGRSTPRPQGYPQVCTTHRA